NYLRHNDISTRTYTSTHFFRQKLTSLRDLQIRVTKTLALKSRSLLHTNSNERLLRQEMRVGNNLTGPAPPVPDVGFKPPPHCRSMKLEQLASREDVCSNSALH